MAKTKTRRVDTGIEQRGDAYRFTVYMGYDRNGKQIRKTTTFVPPTGLTQKKADKLAKEEYIDFSNRCKGLFNLKENMRFSELVDDYFRLYAPNNLKPVTEYNYKQHIDYHFMEYFGNKKLKDITTASINHFFATHKTMVKGEMKTLSPANAKRIYCILQSLFKFAVIQGCIKETPCRNVLLPKKSPLEEQKQMHLTAEELPKFLELFTKEYSAFNTIILTLLHTGMRSGECLGLQWEDIDFEQRKIHIRHNLTDVAGKHFLTTPKSPTSIRDLYMNDNLMALLKKHKHEQRKLQMALGSSFSHPEMVFTSSTGNYKDRSSLNTSLKRFLKGTGFEYLTLHKLRHTNATLLLNNGIDLKIVSEHLGHADIHITANTYTAVLDSSRIKTANLMEQLLAEQTPNKHQMARIG
ncbi:MAG: site-specific integrase [Agathobacter sp.]|nr:site-specific integrase [Agathobacter sp.]